MASGRSGQLVVTGAKDALTSSRAQHVHRSPATESAYYQQRRFEDTALVIFQQHVKRLKEVSPGHYTPLPTDTPTPSLHLLGSGRAGFSLHTDLDRATLGLDRTSTGSGGSAHRADTSLPGSSGARTSLRDDRESLSSVDKPPEDRCGPVGGDVEENGVSDQVFAYDELTATADAAGSPSDSSSVASSEPDSDLDEGGPLAGTSVRFSHQTDVAEDLHLAENIVGSDRDSSSSPDSPVHVSHSAEVVRIPAVDYKAEDSETPTQGEYPINRSAPHSPISPLLKEPPPFNEPSSQPHSPNGLSLVNEPLSFSEPPLQREPHSPREPISLPSPVDVEDLSASSDEEVQITHL